MLQIAAPGRQVVGEAEHVRGRWACGGSKGRTDGSATLHVPRPLHVQQLAVDSVDGERRLWRWPVCAILSGVSREEVSLQ